MFVARFAFQACALIRLRSRFEISASYGEMSRRSGEAAEADSHSAISPFKHNNLQPRLSRKSANCVTPFKVLGSLTAISSLAARGRSMNARRVAGCASRFS